MKNKNIFLLLSLFAGVFGAIFLLNDILLPFLLSIIAAYFLDPLCDRIENITHNRTLATVIITLLFFICLIIVMGLIIPPLYAEVTGLISNIPSYISHLQQLIQPYISGLALPMDSQQWMADIKASDEVQKIAQWLLGKLSEIWVKMGVMFNIFSLFLITPVVTFYLLRDWDKMVAICASYIPPRYADNVGALANDIHASLSGYIRGQALICAFIAVILSVFLWLINIPYGVTIGLLTGLLSFIPYIGQFIGFSLAFIIAVVSGQGYMLPLLVCALFAVTNMIESMVLTPRLIGENVGLHAVWIIFALLAGGQLFGFMGVLLALPMAAILGVLIRFLLKYYRQSSLYSG